MRDSFYLFTVAIYDSKNYDKAYFTDIIISDGYPFCVGSRKGCVHNRFYCCPAANRLFRSF